MRLRKRETCSAFDPCDNELITIYCTFLICIFIHYTLHNIIIYLVYIKVVVCIGISLFHSQGFSGGICCLQTNHWSRQLDWHFIHRLFRIFRIWDRKLAVRLYGNNSKDLKLTLSKCVGIQAVYLTMSAPFVLAPGQYLLFALWCLVNKSLKGFGLDLLCIHFAQKAFEPSHACFAWPFIWRHDLKYQHNWTTSRSQNTEWIGRYIANLAKIDTISCQGAFQKRLWGLKYKRSYNCNFV